MVALINPAWTTSPAPKLSILPCAGQKRPPAAIKQRWNTVPGGKDTVPPGKLTVPYGKGIVPPGKLAAPFGKDTVRHGKLTVPDGKGTVPPGKLAVPGGKDTVRHGNFTVPCKQPNTNCDPSWTNSPAPSNTSNRRMTQILSCTSTSPPTRPILYRKPCPCRTNWPGPPARTACLLPRRLLPGEGRPGAAGDRRHRARRRARGAFPARRAGNAAEIESKEPGFQTRLSFKGGEEKSPYSLNLSCLS